VGPETKDKENHAMTRQSSNRSDATKQHPAGNADLDAYLIDDEFDDVFDPEHFAIRELTHFCNS
jgi:hypothetical protein